MADGNTDPGTAAPDPLTELRDRLVAAALPHVAFDGWSDRTLAQAVEDTGSDPNLARLALPRGGVDLALAFHDMKDRDLAAWLAATDLSGLRFRDRVARALFRRIELIAADREAVRRAAALLALPIHGLDGARAIWRTADTIWTGLGDTDRGPSHYTKRATLSAVWSATVLYWLGDTSEGFAETRAFIDRRIADVMRIEGLKARLTRNPVMQAMAGRRAATLDRTGPRTDTHSA